MDNDLEPILDQMILESYEVNEKLLPFREPKCGAETGEESLLETTQHQESGDIGLVVDPESPKKSTTVKDLPHQNLKTESKTSIFRRKDRRDQAQQADLPGSTKSSTTSLRKFCRWSKQQLIGQGSRWSSQQATDQQPLLSPKASRTQAVNEADVKDPTWVSHRTGKVMKCRSQQTSLIWERKTLSEIMRPTRDESTPSKNAGSGLTTTEKDNTSSKETADERHKGQESCRSSQQLAGKVSKHSSQQHTERFGSLQKNQRSVEQPPTGSPQYPQVHPTKGMDTSEDTTWISQKTGRDMKCQAQQTSHMWEHSALSDILYIYNQESNISDIYGEGSTDEEEDTKPKQAAANNSPQQTLRLEAEKSRQDTHQTKELEESKPEDRRIKSKSKTDRAQQTDSAESIKKEVADSSQQTDVFEGIETSWEGQCQEPDFRTEQMYVQGSQQNSQELVGQDSSPQPELQDSPRSSQQSLRSETETTKEESSEVPSDSESELATPDQKASCIRGSDEDTRVSQKTGRVVKNQRQQTEQSWLLYFALKSQKLKRGISQQTDESFLQQYRASMLKQAVEEHRQSHGQPDMQTCPQCVDLYSEDFHFDPDVSSSFSSMSSSSTTSGLETAGEGNAEEGQSCASGGEEEQPETQQYLGQESQRGSQELGEQEAPEDMGQESQWGSLPAVDDQTHPTWSNEFESNTDSSLLYTEGEDKIQQTYSLISFEDGIWLNRKTGKLLVSRSQQISEISGLLVSGTALEKSSSTPDEGLVPAEMDSAGVGMNQFSQLETEADGQQMSGPESRRGSQQDQTITIRPNLGQPTGEEFLIKEEVEELVCRRLSEATLLSIESPDAEDEPQQIYTVVSLDEGTWLNVLTHKLLASKSQQTEAPEEK